MTGLGTIGLVSPPPQNVFLFSMININSPAVRVLHRWWSSICIPKLQYGAAVLSGHPWALFFGVPLDSAYLIYQSNNTRVDIHAFQDSEFTSFDQVPTLGAGTPPDITERPWSRPSTRSYSSWGTLSRRLLYSRDQCSSPPVWQPEFEQLTATNIMFIQTPNPTED